MKTPNEWYNENTMLATAYLNSGVNWIERIQTDAQEELLAAYKKLIERTDTILRVNYGSGDMHHFTWLQEAKDLLKKFERK